MDTTKIFECKRSPESSGLTYNQQYYANHREYIRAQQHAYLQIRIQCECGANVCKFALARHKKSKRHITIIARLKDGEPSPYTLSPKSYQQRYRETHKAYFAQYYKDHREKLDARRRAQGNVHIQCECGATICKSSLSIHRHSQAHRSKMISYSNLCLSDNDEEVLQ